MSITNPLEKSLDNQRFYAGGASTAQPQMRVSGEMESQKTEENLSMIDS
jgi:hypothetical protein